MFKHTLNLQSKKRCITLSALISSSLFLSACVSQETVVEKKLDKSAAIQKQTSTPEQAQYRFKIKSELAKSYLNNKNYPAAIETIDDLLKEPENQKQSMLYHFKAVALMGMQDAKSLENFEKARSLDANNSHLLNNYGWALCKLGQYDKAHNMLQKANDLADAILYPKVLANQGICYFLNANSNSARNTGIISSSLGQTSIGYLNSSLKINANYLPALLYKARLLAALGQKAPAEEIIQNIAAKNINEPELLLLGQEIWQLLGNNISAGLWGQELLNNHPYSVEAKAYQKKRIQ